ncbi:MAG: glutathione S-transferase family protein [Pseudomonadota bacterium]
MRTLYHMPLDPFCRKIRLILGEKSLKTTLVEERPWEQRAEFCALNPAVAVPVLVDEDPAGDEIALADSYAIAEYLEDVYGGGRVLPGASKARAEARRIAQWFDDKFEAEVNRFVLREKVDKRLKGLGSIDLEAFRRGLDNLRYHLDYVNWLAERRSFLAGERLTLADLAAAAHLSCTDYLDEIPWRDFPFAKDWYAKIKSRPSFRPLLADHVQGFPPPRHYADLDF